MEHIPNQKSIDFIQDESPELSVGENSTWVRHIAKAFPALRSRNYTLYFSGQFISLIGTWLQSVALAWLVLQMTNSAFLIGLVAALGSFPTLVLALVGGVLIDHFPKKYILFFTQGTSMLLACLLGILTVLKIITVQEIMIISFLFGIVNAIDSPTRQAYVSELVPKNALGSAIAMNSGVFNAARIIGPSIAGLLIAYIGTGGAFILNGVSYLAVLVALFFITTPTAVANKHIHPLKAIREGLVYTYNHEVIRNVLFYVGMFSIFAWSYTTILPIVAKYTFHMDASGLGYLYAAIGVGAISAALYVSAYTRKISKFHTIIVGNIIFSVFLFIFSYMNNFILALICLFFTGFGLLACATNFNTIIQSRLDESFRGRVISMYVLIFIGFMPIGNIMIGYLTERIGWEQALRINAFIVLVCGLYILLKRRTIRMLGDRYSS